MFTIIKDKYIRCFVGLFVFMFLSVAACNSYASVCFLPGGDCGETNDDLAFWCEPDDKDCNDANGTSDEYTPGDKPEKTEKPDCTTTCTPKDGHRTCTTDIMGCPIVDKECLNDKYLTEQACESDNNGSDCKLVGTCYEVRTAPEPSGSCDGYNVAKSTLVALQTAFGVSSFDTFMSNLSTYTLEQCTACPADSTKFKCSYVGCPAGKTLYLNTEMAQNGAKSMLSKTELTTGDYKHFGIQPVKFSKSTPKTVDAEKINYTWMLRDQIEEIEPKLCNWCSNDYDGKNPVHRYNYNGNTVDVCVASFLGQSIMDERGLYPIGSFDAYNYGRNCIDTYIDAGEYYCRLCLNRGDSPFTHIKWGNLNYYRHNFSFIPFDKEKQNIAVEMSDCTDSSFDKCQLGSKFADLSRNNIRSLCLNESDVVKEYVENIQGVNSHAYVNKVLSYLNEDNSSSHYGKYPDGAQSVVYVEHEGTSEPETGSCEAIQGQLVSYDTLYKFWEDNFKNYLNNEEDYYTDGWGYTYFPKEETFESFMANLSKYTLDECTTCIDTNGKTQYKCKYAGCPDGKDLYINKYVHYGPITTLFSNTTVSDYQYYSFPEVYQGYYDDNNITMIDEGYLLTPNSSCCSEARNLGVFDVRNYCTNWNMHCYGEDEIDLGYTGNLGYVEESSQGLRDGCSRSIYCKALLNGKDYGGYLEVDVLYGRNICQISSDSLADSCFTLLEYSLSQDPEFYNDHPTFPDGLYRYVYDFNIDYLEADTHQIAHKDDDTMELNTLDGAGAICAGSEIYNYSERIIDKYGAGSQDSWIIDDKSVVFLPPAQWLEENQ